MSRHLTVTGKQGPAFGDGRPSATTLAALDWSDSTLVVVASRVHNWPAVERGDALRAAFAQLEPYAHTGFECGAL